MTTDRWTLAIDVGTSFTAAAIAEDGRRPEVLEVDGHVRLPSMVLLDLDGQLLAGRAAINLSARYPERAERTPKRYVGVVDQLLLGGNSVAVVDAIAAILGRVMTEARRRHNGDNPTRVVLTHPARWQEQPLKRLEEAARLAGLQAPQFVPEPVAAALHYSEVHVEVGQFVAVYDLGGGTFDTAVLRRTRDGFEVAGPPGGIPDMGGEVFDDRLYKHLGAQLASRDPDTWRLLSSPTDRRWSEENADLRSRIRDTKERLSDDNAAELYVSSFDTDLRVTRAEFEELIRSDLELSIEELARTVADTGIAPENLAAVYLTGGSSRIPLVTTIVEERFKRLPATRGDPKCVVALGATQALIQPETAEDLEQHAAGAAPGLGATADPSVSDAAAGPGQGQQELPTAEGANRVKAAASADQPKPEPSRAAADSVLGGSHHRRQASTEPPGPSATTSKRQRPTSVIAGGAVLALLAVIGILAIIRTQGSTPDGALAATTSPGISSAEPTSPPSGGGGQPAPKSKDVTSSGVAEASATAPDNVDSAGNPTTYEASNILDGDPATTWRCEGDCSGERLTITFPEEMHLTKVGLIPGYAKIDPTSNIDRFTEERRIAEATWQFDDGTTADQSLADSRRMQTIKVDAVTTSVVIEIVSTRPPGGERDYTAISEVKLVGAPTS